MPKVQTGYGPGGGVHTRMEREGVDIPEPGDFWSDLRKFQPRVPPAAQQAQALHDYERPMTPGGGLAVDTGMEPIFGVYGLGGVLTPYEPGRTPLGPGQAPVAMGFRRRR